MRRYDEREMEDFIDRNDTLDSLQVSVSPVDLFVLTAHAADYGVDISFTIRNLDTVKSLVLLRGTTKDINTATVVQTYDPNGLKVNDVIKYSDMALELAANECYYWIRAYQNTASANPVDIGYETSRAHNTDTAAPADFSAFDVSFNAAVGGTMDFYVSFPVNTSPNFGKARLYVSGYHGVASPVLIADSDYSQFSFKIDQTGEAVVFTLKAVNATGTAESTGITLAITLSAAGRRAATIYDISATALTNGVQVQFSGGIESNTTSFNVYREPLGGGAPVLVGNVVKSSSSIRYNILDTIGLTGKFQWHVEAVNSIGNSPLTIFAVVLIFDELFGDISGDATIDGISAALSAHGSMTLWRETFDAGANALKRYDDIVGGTIGFMAFPQNGLTGGLVLNNGGKYTWWAYKKNIPFDSSKLYRITCKVRKTAGAFGDYFYCGVEGVAADGVTLVNITGINSASNQHYVCASGEQMVAGAGWKTFTAYFKGWSATPGGFSRDINSPAGLHVNVRYIRPLVILSYPANQGTYEVDDINIDVLASSLDEVPDSIWYSRDVLHSTTENLFSNGDMEAFDDVSNTFPGWTPQIYGSATPQGSPYAGNKCMQVSSASPTQVWQTRSIPVKPGDRFVMAGAAKGITGTERGTWGIWYFNAAGALISGDWATTFSTAWQFDHFTSVAPAGVVSAKIGVELSVVGIQQAFFFDQMYCYRQYDLSTDDAAKRGSTPPSNAPGFSYTSTINSITWTWALTIYRSDDQNTTASPAGSQAITGLGASSTYEFYPYYDEIAAAVSMVATGGTGSPAWAHVGTNRVWSAEQSRQSHIPLSLGSMSASTTGGGGGGGGGGGDGSCLRGDMFVETKRGIIRAIDVRAGDYLKSPRGWTRVLSAEPKLHDVFVRIAFNNGDAVVVTDTHPFTLHDGSSKRVYDMSLQDAVPCTTGVAFPTSITLVKERAFKMSINCEEEHVFFAGEIAPTILTHNMIDPT